MGSIKVGKALHVFTHPGSTDPASLLTGLGALAILVVLVTVSMVGIAAPPLGAAQHVELARLGVVGALVALVIPTAVVLLAGLDSVARVADGGAIPTGRPMPVLPPLHLLSPSLFTGAAAVAAIVVVQGAGVAESAPNPDGPSNANQDFVAQGVANVACGVFAGQPVGGSVGQTALNVSAGGRTSSCRWRRPSASAWRSRCCSS